MVTVNSSETHAESQAAPGLTEIKEIIDAIDATPILSRLQEYRRTGRRGYPLRSLWRAYVASFVLNMASTNDLIRRLQDNLELRLLCGFSTLPSRRTFNRFILRLSDHADLVEGCLTEQADRLATKLPGFGEYVAIDGTVIKAHSNGNRKVISDPDASWAVKNSAASSTGKQSVFGYNYQVVADVAHGIPITGIVTSGAKSEMNMMLPVLDKAEKEHSWFSPKYVIADRGYDSSANSEEAVKRGYSPIIHIRDFLKNKEDSRARLYDGIYTVKGVPTCRGLHPMEFVRSDPKRGHLYRCVNGGCRIEYLPSDDCQNIWVNVLDDPRRFPPVRRDSQRWKDLYAKRQGIERVFKSLKEFRRLESHKVRSIGRIALHMAMSVLIFQTTALVRLQNGEAELIRWQVRKIS